MTWRSPSLVSRRTTGSVRPTSGWCGATTQTCWLSAPSNPAVCRLWFDEVVEVGRARGRQGLEAEVVQDQRVRPQVGRQALLVAAVGAAGVEVGEHLVGAGEQDVE